MWASGDELRMENRPKEEAIKPFNRLLGVKPPVQSYLFIYLFILNQLKVESQPEMMLSGAASDITVPFSFFFLLSTRQEASLIKMYLELQYVHRVMDLKANIGSLY